MTAVVRVVPDVTGLDKEFDYTVPDEWAEAVTVGSVVRVPLHGRRVRGWVVECDPPDGPPPERLRPITTVSSRGPAADVVELARWAAVRWASVRLRPFLVAASPPTNVAGLPPSARGGAPTPALPPVAEPAPGETSGAAAALLAGGGGLLQLPPSDDGAGVVDVAAGWGPVLVVVPALGHGRRLAGELRRRGRSVAVVPQEWARAAAGVDVVIGTRVAAWAPCPDVAVVVVVDEHDEALQEERSPTWHARDVAVERARRAGIPFLATSPCPTVVGLAAVSGRTRRPSIDTLRAGWPIVEVVDRTRDEPWKTSLVTSPLIRHLRRHDEIVVCVHNTPGRARLLACRACRALARCERCSAAVGLDDERRLTCSRCGELRPAVCLECSASAFATLRPGVTRLREELEAAAGRPVVSVVGGGDGESAGAGVYVGTEAVLHRVPRADVVAFLDLDAELLAPRYRAAEQAMALIVRAARLTGTRKSGGRLLLQTFLPRHEVVRAAVLADPARLIEPEAERRRLLRLPPDAAMATVSGRGSDEVAEALRGVEGIDVGGRAGDHIVRADTWQRLGRALLAVPRPKGARLRIAVDEAR